MRGKAFNLTGQRFGKWTVLSKSIHSKHRHVRWRCHCDCGNDRIVRTDVLVNGLSTSCGCTKTAQLHATMIGAMFERLTVLAHHRRNSRGVNYWHCRCACGADCIVRTDHLYDGRIKSCGCFASDNTSKRNYKHGLRRTPEYKIWDGIIERCCNPKSPRYKDYGGRGILICSEWRTDFTKFLEHVGKRPSPKHSIERIDNEKGYEPGNCKWATKEEQANNKRNSVRVDVDGEAMTITRWSHRLGLNPHRLYALRAKGGSVLVDFIRQKITPVAL